MFSYGCWNVSFSLPASSGDCSAHSVVLASVPLSPLLPVFLMFLLMYIDSKVLGSRLSLPTLPSLYSCVYLKKDLTLYSIYSIYDMLCYVILVEVRKCCCVLYEYCSLCWMSVVLLDAKKGFVFDSTILTQSDSIIIIMILYTHYCSRKLIVMYIT